MRRLAPARDDAIPVYVHLQGAVVGKSGDQLEVKQKGQVLQKVRLMEVSHLSLFGNVQVTAQALRELCDRNIPVCHFTYGGWFNGITTGMGHKNVDLRCRQYLGAMVPDTALPVARQIVFGKIKNCRTLLRRNHRDPPVAILTELNRLADRAQNAPSMETLLGIEGAAARTYFSEFEGMIKSKSLEFDFQGRNRRPPRDPVNAVLSFLYAMLIKQATVTALAVGSDPYLGFYHQPKYGKPALALDLVALTGYEAKSGKYAYYICQSLAKRGSGACSAPRLNAKRFEQLIVDQIRENILTESNIRDLVQMVDEEMDGVAREQRDQHEAIQGELAEVRRRLDRLWHAVETTELDINDIAPRIREHRERQERLEVAAEEVRSLLSERRHILDDVETITIFGQDMSRFLTESPITESKAFIRSFVKEIAIRPDSATIRYTIPMPKDSPIGGKDADEIALRRSVLSSVRSGTPGETRTPAPDSGGQCSIL